jgi:hypothetical protein
MEHALLIWYVYMYTYVCRSVYICIYIHIYIHTLLHTYICIHTYTYIYIYTQQVVLVVALDDGVRPQTKEALKMALTANCTVIVALNKVDKVPYGPERVAARARVLGQLMAEGLATEDFGGLYQYIYETI